MKFHKLPIFIALLGGSVLPLHAQWVVTDPGLTAQDALNQVVNFAKYVEMVENQLTQIDHLAQQLAQLEKYNKAFGDPDALKSIHGAGPTRYGLQEGGVGQARSTLIGESDGARSLTDTGNGLYRPISAVSSSGIPITRSPGGYKGYSAVEYSAANFTSVVDDIRARRERCKARIAETVIQIEDASTASEVQKLQGVLSAQAVELAALDQELNAAASQTVVQDITDRTNFRKNEQAQTEAIATDRHDALKKFGALTVPDVQGELRFGRSSR